jgi:hypothetical protein
LVGKSKILNSENLVRTIDTAVMENRRIVEMVCERWKVSIERYGWSAEELTREIGGRNISSTKIPSMGRALAVYGDTGVVGRILLFVVSPSVIRACYLEVIESCIEDIYEELASEFRRDMLELERVMTFDVMSEILEKTANQKESSGPSKRYG